jgi:two-component system response regulator HydG
MKCHELTSTRSFPELISFLDGQAEPSIVMDAEYRIVAANSAYTREFAQGRDVNGKACYEVSHHFSVPCDQAGESCPLRMSQQSGQMQRVLHLHHTPRGEEHVDVAIAPIRDDKGGSPTFVETMRVVKHASSHPAAEGLVGRAASFSRMLSLVMRVAPTDAAVLLLGETGTGKELVARWYTRPAAAQEGPFVAVDCSGLTESCSRANCSATKKAPSPGQRIARSGWSKPPAAARCSSTRSATFRWRCRSSCCACSKPAPTAASAESKPCAPISGWYVPRTGTWRTWWKGDFPPRFVSPHQYLPDRRARADERIDDIPLLANSFLKRVAGDRDLHFSAAALAALMQRRYTGNIRELRNLVERASILADGNEIAPSHLDMDPCCAAGARHKLRVAPARPPSWSTRRSRSKTSSAATCAGCRRGSTATAGRWRRASRWECARCIAS